MTCVELRFSRKGQGRRCYMAVVSSCREMYGYVRQREQPTPLVAIIWLGTPGELPVISGRKVWMTSSPHGPYGLGYTRATMVVTEGLSPKAISVRIVVC